jgi:putative endonuclease
MARRRKRTHWVYILANRRNTVLYIGMTNDIRRRLHEHRLGQEGSFTHRYNVTKLVHLEEHPSRWAARERELQLKNWRRAWKEALVQTQNPAFEDLAPML